MRKFFTSLLLLTAGTGQMLFANPSGAETIAARPLIDHDLAIGSVTGLTSGCDLSAAQAVSINIQNLGAEVIILGDVQIDMSISGPSGPFTVYSGMNMTDITGNSTYTHLFTGSSALDLSVPGTYTITFDLLYPNDPVLTNNTLTVTVVNAGSAINLFPHEETFEISGTNSTWSAHSNATAPNTLSTWELGTPNMPGLNTATSGLYTWGTNLDGNHNPSEQSYVLSPCFDFTGIDPTIMLDVWWNTNSSNGAKLQYTTDNGATWTDITSGPGATNWYNDASLSALSWATGTQAGWGGNGASASNGWVTATHENPGLANMPNVRFRIAFGANTTTTNYGFAFDNFRIYSKDDDVKVTALVSPTSGCDLSSSTDVVVTIQNLGTTDIIGATAGIILDHPVQGLFNPYVDGYPVADIAPGQSINTTFVGYPVDMSTPGTYTFTMFVWYPLDLNMENDTMVFTVVNAGTSINTFPYVEDFEGVSTWAAYSANNTPASASTWALGTPTTPTLPTGTKAWKTNLTGSYNADEQSYVYSPCFDFTGVDPIIEIDVWWNTFANHGAKLEYTLNNGATWTTLGVVGDPDNWYNDETVPGLGWTGTGTFGWAGTGASSSNGWKTARHEWTGLYNKPNVRFRVAFGANGGGTPTTGFAFDNFTITPKPDWDLVAVELMPFAQGCGLSTTEPIQMKIYNNGINPVSNYQVSYTIDPSGLILPYTVTETVTDVIAPFTNYIYTFNQTADLSVSNAFDFTGEVFLTTDQDNDNDEFDTGFLNSVFTAPDTVSFANGTSDLGAFSTITRPESRILINGTGAYSGPYGMVMDGSTETLGWSDFDALTNPFGATSNEDRYSKAIMCVKTPDNLVTLNLGFFLNQMYHNSNFLATNFRVTVNGVAIPLTREDGSIFTPSGNQQAIRPPVTITGNGETGWEYIQANLTPYIDSTLDNMQIAFESSVKFTYDYTTSSGTANLIDSIMINGAYAPISSPEIFTANSVKVYPNPSQGEFSVDTRALATGTYTLEVMDVTGKLVRSEKMNLNGQPAYGFNIADQPKGIYFLKVSSDSKAYTTKLILQ